MPFLIPLLIGGTTLLGGMFVGSQIDDAIEKPVNIVQDQSKMPWYVTLAIWAVVALVAYQFIKKAIK